MELGLLEVQERLQEEGGKPAIEFLQEFPPIA